MLLKEMEVIVKKILQLWFFRQRFTKKKKKKVIEIRAQMNNLEN